MWDKPIAKNGEIGQDPNTQKRSMLLYINWWNLPAVFCPFLHVVENSFFTSPETLITITMHNKVESHL
jgi:hypothetical protein